MSEEFIKIERTIWRRSYGLETKDKLVQISGEELGGHDISSEFKEQLWEDMSIDIDELMEEFGDREDIKQLKLENKLQFDVSDAVKSLQLSERDMPKRMHWFEANNIMRDKNASKKCWICRRTDEESISEFKNLVLDSDNKVDEEYIVHSDIKEIIKNDNITVVPEGADDNNAILMGLEAFNDETGEDIEIKSDHNVFVAVHICHVCDAIFTAIWQSAQNNVIEDMKEVVNEKTDIIISALREIKDE